MARAMFTLRIEMPDRGDMNPNVHDEILDVMEEHDEDEAPAMLRWLGGHLSDGEDAVNAVLPEGFYCKIEGGKIE